MEKLNVIIDKNAVSRLLSIPFVTINVIMDLKRKCKKLYHLKRDLPPTKGAFVQFLQDKGVNRLYSGVKNVKDEVLRAIEKQMRIDSNYKGLLVMEEFQYNQKGPVAPILPTQLVQNVIPQIREGSLHVVGDIQLLQKLERAASDVALKIEKLRSNHQSVEKINFEYGWSLLPSDSVRGLPVLVKGKQSDKQIIEFFGNRGDTVFEKFSQLSGLVSTSGLRFQGSPPKENAKVRLINIPSLYYQYLMNGVYKYLQTIFKNGDCMAAGLDPLNRDAKIWSMCKRAYNNGWSILPLDYRGYDRHLFPGIRLRSTELALSVLPDSSGKKMLLQNLRVIYNNQFLCAPGQNSPISLIPVNCLLPSGIANTQLDGSLANFILQHYIARELGYEIPDDMGLSLGDDTGLPIPNSIMEKYGGYEKVLMYINENLLKPLFMESHDKKAYPEPQLIFLQKLYDVKRDIFGEYSLVRSIDSLVYAEEFRKKIDGIVNLNALETIGQITVLNNPMEGRGKTTLKLFVPIVVRRGLEVDKALCKLAKISAKARNPESFLFNFLVKASGGREAIIRALKLDQYDHTGSLDRLNDDSHGQTFPILSVIISVSKTMLSNDIDIYKVYGTATKIEENDTKGIDLV